MKKYSSFDEYIQDQSERGRILLMQLRDIIHNTIPNTEETMGYGVPAFTLIPKAKLNEKVMIAGYKNHIGFYPHDTTIEAFKEKLKPYKFSTGTVQFKLNDELPEDLIREMLIWRYNVVHNIT